MPIRVFSLLLLGLLTVWSGSGSEVRAADDMVRLGKKTVSGKITKMTSREVTLEHDGKIERFPAGLIDSIRLAEEPPRLTTARSAILSGRYEDASRNLGEINLDQIPSDPIRQEVEFYQALAAAELARRGIGNLRDAGSQAIDFVNRYPNSYHWYAANELVGDLLMEIRRETNALEYYRAIEDVPWKSLQARAKYKIGKALLAAGRPQEAQASFELIDDLGADAPLPLLAGLGKARCLLAQGKGDEALALTQKVLNQVDPENKLVGAEAYNTLGNCLRKAGRNEEALLAFLHVDILYFADADAHAEALANLAELWNQMHRPDRAAEANKTLQNRYRNSRWNRAK